MTGSIDTYQERLEAARTLIRFMGERSMVSYDARTYRMMWDSMERMRQRYGDPFVAATVKKDPTAAELALIREWRMAAPDVPELETEHGREHSARWVKVYPQRRNWRKKLAAVLGILVFALVAFTMIKAGNAIANSDRIIEEADRILEKGERR